MNFDLHTHSNCSHDSKVPPQDLLALAEQAGLDYFSITDHNSAKAHLILQDPTLRSRFGGKIVPAAELSTTFHKVTVELLAYGADAALMQQKIEKIYPPRAEKMRIHGQAMIDACLKAGAKMDPAKVDAFLHMEIPSRPKLMEIIKEFPENRRLLFNPASWENGSTFLRQETNNPQSKLFADVSMLHPSIETVTKLIRDCGGMIFIAHPLIYGPLVSERLQELIDRVQPDGLECFYPAFSAEQTEFLLSICKERNLFACGGSDHHGANRPNPIGEYGQFQARAAKEVAKWIDQIQTY